MLELWFQMFWRGAQIIGDWAVRGGSKEKLDEPAVKIYVASCVVLALAAVGLWRALS